MGQNNTILTQIFTQNSLKAMISSSDYGTILRKVVRRYSISEECLLNNGQAISEIYQYIGKSYRNEYYYKNTLLNKLIINVHRLNTTTALTEVPISRSKADFIMINGKAVVYEIKTELDTFDRLESQIKDYYKAFDHVCIVTSESQANRLCAKLEKYPVGVYALTRKDTIKRLKEPAEYRGALDADCIFRILNKKEYESIIMQIQGSLPTVTPVNYYKECNKILSEIPIERLYPLFLKELKKRNRIDITDYSVIPDALHFLVYFKKCRDEEMEKLNMFLNEQFEEGEECTIQS